MAIKALDLQGTREIISKYDEVDNEEDGATVWVIGALDASTSIRIRDAATSTHFEVGETEEDTTMQTNIARGRADWETVAAGLRGVRNFIDPATGNAFEISFVKRDFPGGKRTVVSNDFLGAIPTLVIEELAEKIRNFNELTERQTKNFGGQPALS